MKSLALAVSLAPAEPSVGATGWIRILDIRVDGMVSPSFRHVIKRYLKRVGFQTQALKSSHVVYSHTKASFERQSYLKTLQQLLRCLEAYEAVI
jgi:hypothetical protein